MYFNKTNGILAVTLLTVIQAMIFKIVNGQSCKCQFYVINKNLPEWYKIATPIASSALSNTVLGNCYFDVCYRQCRSGLNSFLQNNSTILEMCSKIMPTRSDSSINEYTGLRICMEGCNLDLSEEQPKISLPKVI